MHYRKFGNLDTKVSALGFGCMRLPVVENNSGNIDESEAIRMIRYGIDHGINYVDTAYGYHEKMSEILVGKALKDGYREKVSLTTKLPVWFVNESADYDKLLDEQLKKLQVNHLDFYLFHNLNKDNWQKVLDLNLFKKAEAAKADGRIRHIGFSFHDNLQMFKTIVDSFPWEVCQIQYNYMNVEVQAGTEGLKYAAAKGLGVIVMEPLLGGKLARHLPAVDPIWEAARPQRTGTEWALQWLWNQPEVSLVLSGMSTMDQVVQNLAAADRSAIGSLSADQLTVFDTARKTINQLSPIPCTKCEYCLPCPQGVNIPRNFDIYNQVGMFNDIEHPRFEYQHFLNEESKASKCIQCQTCESKCPQHISISEWMPVVDEVLGQDKPYRSNL